MKKAFDRLEWKFIEKSFRELGSSQHINKHIAERDTSEIKIDDLERNQIKTTVK